MKPYREQTYYELLEISPSASMEEIRAAYDRCVQFYDPENVALYPLGDPAEVEDLKRLLLEAMEILTEPDLRQEYDRSLGLGGGAESAEIDARACEARTRGDEDVQAHTQPPPSLATAEGAGERANAPVRPRAEAVHSTAPRFAISYIPTSPTRAPEPESPPRAQSPRQDGSTATSTAPRRGSSSAAGRMTTPRTSEPARESHSQGVAAEPERSGEQTADSTSMSASPAGAAEPAQTVVASPESTRATEPASTATTVAAEPVSTVEAQPESTPAPASTSTVAEPPEHALEALPESSTATGGAEAAEPIEAKVARTSASATTIVAEPERTTQTPAPPAESITVIAEPEPEPARASEAQPDPTTPPPTSIPAGPAATPPVPPDDQRSMASTVVPPPAPPSPADAQRAAAPEAEPEATPEPPPRAPEPPPPEPPPVEVALVHVPAPAARPSRDYRGRDVRVPPARDLPPRPRALEIPSDAEFNGELIRQIRKNRGYSILQLAERTRITSRHLENVEADRYDALPPAVYLRGILMSLARELGMDPVRVAKSYLELVERSKPRPR